VAQLNASELIEDHALSAVPADERQSWVALSWNTAGLVTTLVQLFFGALVAFTAGLKIALLAGVTVTVVGAALGWLVGHVGYKSGLSSTVLARQYGFGLRGSAVASVIFGFMIIGFLALENAILYKGVLLYFAMDDTLGNAILVYGLFSVAWILLTTYGFGLLTRVSSLTLILFLLVLAYLGWKIVSAAGLQAGQLLGFGAQLPSAVLATMGAESAIGKFAFAVNILIGSAGALALVDADLGRYARRSADIGIAAIIGNVFMDIVIVAIGGVVMYAATPALTDFYMHGRGVTVAEAQTIVLGSPDSVAAVFIVFGGIVGTALMFLAQAKAQVINTYSASLSLSNLGAVLLGRNLGRLTWVIIANLIGLVLLYGQILALVNAYITLLGILTTAFAGLIIADFYIVRRGRPAEAGDPIAAVNWPGIVTIVAAPLVSIYLMGNIVPIKFVTTLAVTLVLYPLLTGLAARSLPAIPVPTAGAGDV
jgi:cytosine permease